MYTKKRRWSFLTKKLRFKMFINLYKMEYKMIHRSSQDNIVMND